MNYPSIYFIWHVTLCPSFQDHESIIKAIYTGSEFLDGASAGGEVGVVLESSSFYAEQGGQVLHSCTILFLLLALQWVLGFFFSLFSLLSSKMRLKERTRSIKEVEILCKTAKQVVEGK